MAPQVDINALKGPAFDRIPPFAKAKLRPIAVEKIQQVYDFVEERIIPLERVVSKTLEETPWATPQVIKDLREEAKRQGLWNLFLPNHFKESPAGLTNLEYACCCELMGRCYWAQQVFNCHAPETGNMELLAKYCNEKQKEKWLKPLMDGTASSVYSMTEPDQASSDATNISIRMHKDGDGYVINGRKFFGNCLWNKEVKFLIVMVCSDPDNSNPWKRHSTVIVPADSPGLRQVRNLTVLGYDWASEGHAEFVYDNVRIPAENVILGPGEGFTIAQGRLGPGRTHHCLRLLGQCERAVELAIVRATDEQFRPRKKVLAQNDEVIGKIASMRMELDAMRLICYNACDTMDLMGNVAGRRAIAQAKVLVPATIENIISECMQIYGGTGLTQVTPLPKLWAYARWARLADGPDAAHRHQVGREELKKGKELTARHQKYNEREKQLAEQHGIKLVLMPEDTL
ncbi:acyl-CoA dehydrogenase, middle domain-containing protein [Sarocladium implicatum]|nr:acyl-CoA dehydrogenase, middle domain-containing protein [Sarocladium implicatum]